MMIGPQDALGVLYSFILVVCPVSEKDCANHDHLADAIVRRQDGMSLFECETRIEWAGQRITGDLQGRVWMQCEKHEEPNA
jgi:hypothetical protein